MRLSSYMRGLGIGMVVAALLMGISRQPVSLTDREIKEKARKLGMVEKDSVVLSNALPKSLEDTLEDSISLNDVILPVEDGALVETVSADIAGTDAGNSEGINSDAANSDAVNSDSKEGASSSDKDGSAEDKKSSSSVEKEDSSSEEKKDSSSEEKKDSSSEVKKSSSSKDKKDSSSEAKKSSSSDVKKSSSFDDKKKDSSSEAKKSSSVKKSSSAKTSSSAKKSSSAKSEAAVPVKNSVSKEDKYITISPGDSSTTVANKLEAAGIIKDATAFDSFLCEAGYDRRITTGKKMIPAGASEVEIAGIITVR